MELQGHRSQGKQVAHDGAAVPPPLVQAGHGRLDIRGIRDSGERGPRRDFARGAGIQQGHRGIYHAGLLVPYRLAGPDEGIPHGVQEPLSELSESEDAEPGEHRRCATYALDED